MQFFDTDTLRDQELFLELDHTSEARPEEQWLPAYVFRICLSDGTKIGHCDLRIGHNERTYIGGNIGYGIDEAFRGHHYAAKACRLLFRLARRHGMDHVIITCDPDNTASARTCEMAGGRYVETARIPEDHDMYARGLREVLVYRFDLDESLKPGKRFPLGMHAPDRETVLSLLGLYGIGQADSVRLVDSTHDESDVRLNYLIDHRYVLRFCNAPGMTETRMQELSRLIDRYHSMQIVCPQFVAQPDGRYLHTWSGFLYYLSEYADLPVAGDMHLPDAKRLVFEVAESVARFADRFRNVDLSETMGMYSLFDLSPLDQASGIDEKEENFRQLTDCLNRLGLSTLANRLGGRYAETRRQLKAVYRDLPRCVFQGDENFSNILVDTHGHFAGFIDFNFAGTEVVVNQFANLAGFDYDERETVPVGAGRRLQHALGYYREHIGHMLKHYRATEKELQALVWYAWIVMLVQWPTLCFFRDALEGDILKDEIAELLSLIAELPETELMQKSNTALL